MACAITGFRATSRVMPYWCCQIDARREELAVHCLRLAEYTIYAPRIKAARQGGNGRGVLLFPGYLFLVATSSRGWWRARWSPGVYRLILSGEEPAVLSDQIVNELKARENRHGFVVLPSRRRDNDGGAKFHPGDQVRIAHGVFSGLHGLASTMRPHERVAVLLELLGGQRAVELAASAVARV
jgi:transcriptional antiterminator RfaH